MINLNDASVISVEARTTRRKSFVVEPGLELSLQDVFPERLDQLRLVHNQCSRQGSNWSSFSGSNSPRYCKGQELNSFCSFNLKFKNSETNGKAGERIKIFVSRTIFLLQIENQSRLLVQFSSESYI